MGAWDARCPVCHSWVWTTKDGTRTVPHITARQHTNKMLKEWCAGSGKEVTPATSGK